METMTRNKWLIQPLFIFQMYIQYLLDIHLSSQSVHGLVRKVYDRVLLKPYIGHLLQLLDKNVKVPCESPCS